MRNPWICITIVLTIGAFGLLALAGVVALAISGREVTLVLAVITPLVGIASGALGSLSSFLVNVPRGSVGDGSTTTTTTSTSSRSNTADPK